MMFDFLGLRKSVESLGSTYQKLRAEIEALKRRREEIDTAPPGRQDMIDILCGNIDQAAQEYPAALLRQIGSAMHGNKTANMKNWRLGMLLPQANAADGNIGPQSLMTGLAFIFNAEIKASVARAVQAMEWPDNSIPLAKREKELSRLDAEIASLEKELAALGSDAAKAGIHLA